MLLQETKQLEKDECKYSKLPLEQPTDTLDFKKWENIKMT